MLYCVHHQVDNYDVNSAFFDFFFVHRGWNSCNNDVSNKRLNVQLHETRGGGGLSDVAANYHWAGTPNDTTLQVTFKRTLSDLAGSFRSGWQWLPPTRYSKVISNIDNYHGKKGEHQGFSGQRYHAAIAAHSALLIMNKRWHNQQRIRAR